MKRIITTITAILMIVFTASAFSACKDKNQTTEEDKFEDTVSDKITAEEWAELVKKPTENTENFRIEVFEKYTRKTDESGKELEDPLIKEGTGFVEVKEGIEYRKAHYSTGETTEMLFCPDNKNKKWRFFAKDTFEEGWAEWKDEADERGSDLFRWVDLSELNFNDFEYSEEYKGYVYREGSENGESSIQIIKFKDGNFIGEKSVTADNDLEIVRTYYFCDFGKVEDIQIPDEVIQLMEEGYQP